MGTLLAVAVAAAILLVLRRIRLLRSGGISVALRTRLDESGRGWHLGIGRYHGDEFSWFRPLSLRAGPDRVINRGGLEIATRREPQDAESYSMPPGSQVLRCKGAGELEVEIAMGPDALTGFLSWLESAPPGRRLPWAS
nr:DUF2550 domain-containing protein [Herbihabitans rhizosphaerae]